MNMDRHGHGSDTNGPAIAVKDDAIPLDPELEVDDSYRHSKIMELLKFHSLQLDAQQREGQRQGSILKHIQTELREALTRCDLSSSNESGQKQVARLQKRLLSRERERCRMSRQVRRAEKAKRTCEKETQLANEAIHSLSVQLETSQKERDAALQELKSRPKTEGFGSFANASKTSDTTIQSQWKLLMFNVGNLAAFLGQSAPRCELSGSLKKDLQAVDHNYAQLLQDDNYREALLEAHLCRLLYIHILDGGLGVHIRGGKTKSSFRTMRSELLDYAIPDPQLLSKLGPWLAQGSQFIERPQDDIGFKDFCDHVTDQMRPFFAEKTRRANQSRTREEFSTILKIALELDEIFMSSKAAIVMEWEDYHQTKGASTKYRADMMDGFSTRAELSQESKVKFFISPILFKIGNADGQNYDKVSVLAKARVVCD